MNLLLTEQAEGRPNASRPTNPPVNHPTTARSRISTSAGRPRRTWSMSVLAVGSALWLLFAFVPRPGTVRTYLGPTMSEDDLGRHIEQRRQELGIPGLTVAIINGGSVVFTDTFGHADVAAGLPVTDRTIFEAASLSKPMFAHFVMTFVEDGSLDLDRPLVEYLPHPEVTDPRGDTVTARMVLSHQAGFPNWRDGGQSATLPIAFEPGTDFEYSGEGYQYLARVLAEVAGTDWAGLDRLFQERIAEPLGLSDTTFVAGTETLLRKAEPYDETGTRIEDSTNPAASGSGADISVEDGTFVAGASVHTTAADFATWMIAVADRQLLGPAAYDELLAPHASPPDEGLPLAYTLGFYAVQLPLTDLYGHGGNNHGFTSFFMIDVDDDWGFVVLTNSEYGQQFGEELLSHLVIGPSPARLMITVAAAGFWLVAVAAGAVTLLRRRRSIANAGR